MNNKIVITTYISIITLNLLGLNALINSCRVVEWKRTQDPYICCLPETYFRSKETHRLKRIENNIVYK